MALFASRCGARRRSLWRRRCPTGFGGLSTRLVYVFFVHCVVRKEAEIVAVVTTFLLSCFVVFFLFVHRVLSKEAHVAIVVVRCALFLASVICLLRLFFINLFAIFIFISFREKRKQRS